MARLLTVYVVLSTTYTVNSTYLKGAIRSVCIRVPQDDKLCPTCWTKAAEHENLQGNARNQTQGLWLTVSVAQTTDSVNSIYYNGAIGR